MTLRFRSTLAPLFLFAASLSMTACSWTSDGGLGERVESDVRTKSSSEASWQGEPLRIHDEHGQVEIVGVPGKRNITVHAKMVAGATSQADANAAFDDLFEQIAIQNLNGIWVVTCGHARQWHGSVDPESTGCAKMTVEIPAGSADAPIALEARADYGGVYATGLVVSRLYATAPFGLAADVTPISGADIEMRGDEIVSGFCSSIVRVPADFAVSHLALTVKKAELRFAGDPDGRFVPGVAVEGLPALAAESSIAPRTPSFIGHVGDEGKGAARVVLHADQGRAVVTTRPLPPAQEMTACTNYDPIEVTVSAPQ